MAQVLGVVHLSQTSVEAALIHSLRGSVLLVLEAASIPPTAGLPCLRLCESANGHESCTVGYARSSLSPVVFLALLEQLRVDLHEQFQGVEYHTVDRSRLSAQVGRKVILAHLFQCDFEF